MTHLFVILIGDVDAIDFDDAVAPAQLSRLCRRISVNFADALTSAFFIGVQIEAETVEIAPLDDVAQTRRRWLGRDALSFLHHFP